ncbi:MAG: nucleotide exchange factor GrpE, partial [Planctomycetota bacterium]
MTPPRRPFAPAVRSPFTALGRRFQPLGLALTAVSLGALGSPAAALAQDDPAAPLAGDLSGDQLPRVLRLTLADAVDLAVQNNLDLVLAQLEEDGLRLDYLSTWGSFDPLLESGLNYVDAETPQAFSGLAGDVPVVNQKFTSLSSSLSQLLTTGG